MITLIETKHECNPCSGGWPNLVVKEWDIQEFPGLFAHLSYYAGNDVKPLPSLSIRKRENNREAYQNSLLPRSVKGWDDTIPDESDVQYMVSIALAD